MFISLHLLPYPLSPSSHLALLLNYSKSLIEKLSKSSRPLTRQAYFQDTPHNLFWFLRATKELTYDAGLHLHERRCIRWDSVVDSSRVQGLRGKSDTPGIMERNVLGISHEVRDPIKSLGSLPLLPSFLHLCFIYAFPSTLRRIRIIPEKKKNNFKLVITLFNWFYRIDFWNSIIRRVIY